MTLCFGGRGRVFFVNTICVQGLLSLEDMVALKKAKLLLDFDYCSLLPI